MTWGKAEMLKVSKQEMLELELDVELLELFILQNSRKLTAAGRTENLKLTTLFFCFVPYTALLLVQDFHNSL